ncbi:hypothetical protein NK6_1346 [Bradyrhizobium diazoefficiens]|uniref:Uncharacterized protein n=1 Tax=Bradyrhizobium diazoefficiens TaxID=1355477 RepID=A0A0E3VSU7_9BRAD|nr:hypothetical protein NK6_1346 [Bradyrhizobium diazoefficiens]
MSGSGNKKGPEEGPCTPPVMWMAASHPRRCAWVRRR